MAASPIATPWRVCVTRDEDAGGPLSTALGAQGFEPVLCPVLVEHPPQDTQALDDAAHHLDRYEWVVCASARSARALTRARGGAVWPRDVLTAAVGDATARALVESGAEAPLVSTEADGAEALWTLLEHAVTWHLRRVLVLTTPGGRRLLAERLRAAGAIVDEVEAYRMTPRDQAAIAHDWALASPDAAIIASPRVAEALVGAVGAHALTTLRQVMAIGRTTASTLERLGVPCAVPPRADFVEAARMLAGCRRAMVES